MLEDRYGVLLERVGQRVGRPVAGDLREDHEGRLGFITPLRLVKEADDGLDAVLD
jgi:hypothetical protein